MHYKVYTKASLFYDYAFKKYEWTGTTASAFSLQW